MTGPRVAVVGYGTIGKRVAAAVTRQPDMQLAGVAVRSVGPSLLPEASPGIPFFGTAPSTGRDVAAAGVELHGSLEDLLTASDVVVDCTQSKTAAARKDLYAQNGVLAVFCGGETHASIGFTFSPHAAYDAARGRSAARVTSCNTTAIARLVDALEPFGVAAVHVALVRCSTDPAKARRGIVAGATVCDNPSHHAEDVSTLWPDLPVYTQAVAVPMVHGHVAMARFELAGSPEPEAVVDRLRRRPRIVVDDVGPTTCDVTEAFAERPRGDRPELFVWAASIDVRPSVVYLTASVGNESIAIPDTIDCVRAVTGMHGTAADAMYATDVALGISRERSSYDAPAAGPRARGGLVSLR